jgi:hypothetical protein
MDDLKKKILEMYPNISKYGLDVSLEFLESENAYVVKLKKGEHELKTFLDKKDADECMNNIKCVYLGLHIAEFVKDFELLEKEL